MKRLINRKLISLSLLSVAMFVSFSAQSATQYTFTDLGTLAGNTNSFANAINNSGQIVGSSGSNAVIWNLISNTYNPIALGAGVANGINDLGQVVGSSTQTASTSSNALLWNNTNGVYTSTTLGQGVAYDINNTGKIVGATQGSTYSNATVWSNSGFVKNYTLHSNSSIGSFASANAVNNLGQSVGYISTSNSNVSFNATVGWDQNAFDFVGSGLDTYSYKDVNDKGQIVGGNGTGAMMWNPTTKQQTTLSLNDSNSSFASGINESGVIIGTNNFGGSLGNRAALWENGSVLDLNSLSNASTNSFILKSAEDINDNGWIVGNAFNSITGQTHAFLLTPVPEPELALMFTVGLGLLGFAKRRKAK